MRSTKTIAWVNGKGGVGKSTGAWNLLGMACMPGHGRIRACGLDADPQLSLIDWKTNRDSFLAKNPRRGLRPIDVFAPEPDADEPTAKIDLNSFLDIYENRVVGGGYHWCVVDTKGIDDKQGDVIVSVADLVLIPCSDAEPEWRKLWRPINMIQRVAQQTGKQIQTHIVLNKLHTSTGASSIARLAQMIMEETSTPVAPFFLSLRTPAIKAAYGSGLCVEEIGTDPAASGEWGRLFDFVASCFESDESVETERKIA